MFRDFDILDVIICFILFIIGICAVIFVTSFVRDSDEKDCVDFYEEHNGYILKSCEKYSDSFRDLIRSDL